MVEMKWEASRASSRSLRISGSEVTCLLSSNFLRTSEADSVSISESPANVCRVALSNALYAFNASALTAISSLSLSLWTALPYPFPFSTLDWNWTGINENGVVYLFFFAGYKATSFFYAQARDKEAYIYIYTYFLFYFPRWPRDFFFFFLILFHIINIIVSPTHFKASEIILMP